MGGGWSWKDVANIGGQPGQDASSAVAERGLRNYQTFTTKVSLESLTGLWEERTEADVGKQAKDRTRAQSGKPSPSTVHRPPPVGQRFGAASRGKTSTKAGSSFAFGYFFICFHGDCLQHI